MIVNHSVQYTVRYMNWFIFGFGVLMLLGGISSLYWRYRQFSTMRRTTGQISDYISKDSVDGEMWHTVASFTSDDGSIYSVISRSSIQPKPTLPIGSPKEILYDPFQPQNAEIYSAFEYWIAPVIIFGVGFFCSIGSIVSK